MEQQLNPGTFLDQAPSCKLLGQLDRFRLNDQVGQERLGIGDAAKKFVPADAGENDSISLALHHLEESHFSSYEPSGGGWNSDEVVINERKEVPVIRPVEVMAFSATHFLHLGEMGPLVSCWFSRVVKRNSIQPGRFGLTLDDDVVSHANDGTGINSPTQFP